MDNYITFLDISSIFIPILIGLCIILIIMNRMKNISHMQDCVDKTTADGSTYKQCGPSDSNLMKKFNDNLGLTDLTPITPAPTSNTQQVVTTSTYPKSGNLLDFLKYVFKLK